LSILVLQNNSDLLSHSNHDENIGWLLDALWLTGVYLEAKDLLYHPEKWRQLQYTLQQEKTILSLTH
jgi:hypothetical protein